MNKSQKALADELEDMRKNNHGFTDGERYLILKLRSKPVRRRKLGKRRYQALKGTGTRHLGATHALVALLKPDDPPRPDYAAMNRHPEAA